MIVADTNLVAYLLIEGDHTRAARRVYETDPDWALPPLWRSEFLSVLAVSVRGDVLTLRQARRAWRNAVALVAGMEQEPDPTAILKLAVEAGVSAYDAQFVALARMLGTRLVTADRRLARRFPKVAVLMSEFAEGGAG